MANRHKFDELFSEMKKDTALRAQKRANIWQQIEQANRTQQQPSSRTHRWRIIATIVICSALIFLTLQLVQHQRKPHDVVQVEQPSVEPSIDATDRIYDVASFGTEQRELKADILQFLSELSMLGYKPEEVFHTVKVNEDVALVNFKSSFVTAYNDSMGTAGAGEFLRHMLRIIFTEQQIETVHFLLDGNATAWNTWLQFVDEPISRAQYEAPLAGQPSFDELVTLQQEQFFVQGIALGSTQEDVIAAFGADYDLAQDVFEGGDGLYDRLTYAQRDMTFLFSSNKLVRLIMPIYNEKQFYDYFTSYTGTKLTFEVEPGRYSDSNAFVFFFEQSAQVGIAKYGEFGRLFFTIQYVAPEVIENYKQGIFGL